MSSVIRKLVEESLEGMESGKFQDFCLDFLPLWDGRFRGLARFGHTAAGKTRAGTPDLLLTKPDGSQIGVQCGTEENYWKQPDDVVKWKPYADAIKCIETLTNLIEIVIVANREIPTNKPNTKSALIGLLEDKTGAVVTPLAREDVSQFISSTLHTPPTKRLLQAYFQEAFQAFVSEEEAQRLGLGRSISSERPVDARTLIAIIDQAVECFGHTEKLKEYVVGQLDELSYRLTSLPKFNGIQRKSVDDLHLKSPLSKIWSLIGVPKIGKTSLLLQLSNTWASFDIHWYDCPHEEECAAAIVADLIKTLLPSQSTDKLMKSEVVFEATLKDAESLSRPVVFIIDNAENLSEKGLKQLSDTICTIKRHEIAASLAVVFASNRRLAPLATVTDLPIVAPPWTASELADLLRLSNIQFDEQDKERYLDLLESFSGGHPLTAKFLASKWPTAAELLVGQLTPLTKSIDENLSKEVQVLLYEDILKDADSQNLVQRLSVLTGHTPEDILDVLRIEVSPQITQSAIVIIERVGGSVIEGDSTIGYSVPRVFREVARQKISKDEAQRVFKVVSSRLLIPKGQIIDAGRATSGLFYLMCAGDFDQIYYWTTFLVSTALKRDLKDAQLSVLLDRLHFTSILNSPEGLVRQITHGLMMITLATAYCHVRQYKTAAEILERIKIDSVPTSKELDLDAARHIQIQTVMLKAVICTLSGSDSPLSKLSESDLEALFESDGQTRHEYLELLSQFILSYPISGLEASLVRGITSKVESTGLGDIEACFDLACNIGVRAKKEALDAGLIEKYFISTAFGRLLRDVSYATLMIELRQSKPALLAIERAMDAARGLGVTNARCWSHLYQVRGDGAYQLEDKPLSEESYSLGLKYSQPSSFDRAWASWRLGLLKNEEQMFDKAAAEFKSKGHIEYWARSLGARGALLIRSGKMYEGVRCLHDLITAYFVSGEDAAGPATTLALSHLSRLKSELEGEPLDSANLQFPEIKSSLYETVLESARPLSGPILAYFILGQTYRLLGNQVAAFSCIVQGLNFVPTHQKDIYALPVILNDFMVLLSNPALDRAHTKLCVQRAISHRSLGGTTPLAFTAYCLFDKADKDSQRGSNLSLIELLNFVDEVLRDSPQNEQYWKSEVLIRRARLIKESGDRLNLKDLYARSLVAAKAAENTGVMIESSHALGFEFATEASSLEELAEVQFVMIKAVEMQNENIDHLLVHGENLFNLWRNIDWRRLLATDIKTKNMLMDSAKEMGRAGTPSALTAPVMVFLLAKLFNHSGPSVEWARTRCLPWKDNLPAYVSGYLDSLT